MEAGEMKGEKGKKSVSVLYREGGEGKESRIQ